MSCCNHTERSPPLAVSIDERYTVARINNWVININNNTIQGTARVFGIDFEVPIKGNVVGYLDRHIMARVNAKLYAYVPGNIQEGKEYLRPVFFKYLRNLAPKVEIIL